MKVRSRRRRARPAGAPNLPRKVLARVGVLLMHVAETDRAELDAGPERVGSAARRYDVQRQRRVDLSAVSCTPWDSTCQSRRAPVRSRGTGRCARGKSRRNCSARATVSRARERASSLDKRAAQVTCGHAESGRPSDSTERRSMAQACARGDGLRRQLASWRGVFRSGRLGLGGQAAAQRPRRGRRSSRR